MQNQPKLKEEKNAALVEEIHDKHAERLDRKARSRRCDWEEANERAKDLQKNVERARCNSWTDEKKLRMQMEASNGNPEAIAVCMLLDWPWVGSDDVETDGSDLSAAVKAVELNMLAIKKAVDDSLPMKEALEKDKLVTFASGTSSAELEVFQGVLGVMNHSPTGTFRDKDGKTFMYRIFPMDQRIAHREADYIRTEICDLIFQGGDFAKNIPRIDASGDAAAMLADYIGSCYAEGLYDFEVDAMRAHFWRQEAMWRWRWVGNKKKRAEVEPEDPEDPGDENEEDSEESERAEESDDGDLYEKESDEVEPPKGGGG